MTDVPAAPRSVREAATIAPVTIDDLSHVRYVHGQSLRASVAGWARDDELAAYSAYVYGPVYGADLEVAVRAGRLHGAYLGAQLLGTAGWSSAPDDTLSARIRWCHVQPMFSGLGLGLALLSQAETHAAGAGHTTLIARSTPDAAGFFERAGYGITAHGTRTVAANRTLPVVFLRKHLIARPGMTLI